MRNVTMILPCFFAKLFLYQNVGEIILPHPIEASTLRILKPTGETVGTGFLVSKNLAVTCAHVIKILGAGGGDTVDIRFTGKSAVTTARVLPESYDRHSHPASGSGKKSERKFTFFNSLFVCLLALAFGAVLMGCAPNVTGKIAFMSDRDGNLEIYVMNADGSNPIRLTNNLAYDGAPAWSPDGSKIAFSSNRDGNPEIYVMNVDGSNQINLTNNPGYDVCPAWSPDGSKLAFHSKNREGNDENFEIYVMNADGSNPIRLTYSSGVDFDPNWSPDGNKIVFWSGRGGSDNIYVMNADGSNLIQLTNSSASDLEPVWSPDGTKIIFWSNRDDAYAIYLMHTDGSNQNNITKTLYHATSPFWSPDGSKIVFVCEKQICLMNADGSGVHRLTNASSANLNPAWTK